MENIFPDKNMQRHLLWSEMKKGNGIQKRKTISKEEKSAIKKKWTLWGNSSNNNISFRPTLCFSYVRKRRERKKLS
jgi:hypothetical protein